MKNPALPLLLATACTASAANLMINLRTPDGSNANAGGDVAGADLTLSPAHAAGAIPGSETTWNNFSATAPSSSLSYADGSAASGVTVTFGSESGSLVDTLDYTTTATINTTALRGSGGGTPGTTTLLADAGSVYGDGDGPSNTAAGRAGWFGNASGANDGMGLRVDGLTAGDYTVYLMGRNTNSSSATPMNLFVASASLSTLFDYSVLTPVLEGNLQVPDTEPTGHNTFRAGDNFVAVHVTVGDGESLYIATDGAGSEVRGFLNMVQISAVPEPSVALLALGGGLLLLRRRR